MFKKPQEAAAWQYAYWDGERHSLNWHTNKFDYYYRDRITGGYVKGIPLYKAQPNYEALVKENERLREALKQARENIGSHQGKREYNRLLYVIDEALAKEK